MKPVNCQSLPSTVNTEQPQGFLVRTPRFRDTMHCGKCGFATSDIQFFKQHMSDHMAYKADLNALEKHVRSSFSCPYCGQRYMRRCSLLKHIQCVHNKTFSTQVLPQKVSRSKDPQVSNAIQNVQSAERTMQPPVQVNVPSLSMPTVSLVKDGQKARTMNTILPVSSNDDPESVIHHNRALTVSLPDEISIPAGCLVELVEVKTVNGSKELKLRLVSQENKAEMKDTRTTCQQNVTTGKTLASKLNRPNDVNLANMGMCIVNRKQSETKTAGQQCAFLHDLCSSYVKNTQERVNQVSTSKSLTSNQASKEKHTLKRTSQEVIIVDSPTKVYKKERSEIASTRSDPVNDRAKLTNFLLTSETKMSTCVPQPAITGSCVPQLRAYERLKNIPDHCKSVPPAKAARTESSLRDMVAAVKSESDVVCLTGSKVMNTPLGVNQQPTSLNIPPVANVRVLPPKVNLCQESATPPSSLPVPATVRRPVRVYSSVKARLAQSRSESKIPPHGVPPSKQSSQRDTPKPEGFPIISSVFSLSEQEGATEGAMQPLVMALRGIVMDKSSTAEKSAPDANRKERVPMNRTCDSVKVESDIEIIQQQPSSPVLNDKKDDVKAAKTSSTQTDNPSHAFDLKSEKAEPVSNNPSDVAAVLNNQYDLSKFLTVSLTRVDERMDGANGPQLPAPQCDSLTAARSTARLMPLKVEQLVTWPGPNQPVVVLNHPKPRVPMQETISTIANTGITEKPTKCQILKMRLVKVVGQKYEVTGCTVRFPQ
ncbi:uncharacterized protein znf518b [Festucalex cinctus]